MSIWQNRFIKKSIETQNFITLEEGNTALEIFSDGDKKLFVKREDQNPTGSWKDRGTAYKITALLNQGIKEIVLSSSGNAAISFLTYASQVQGFKIHVVVSDEAIDDKKLEKINELIKNTNHEVHFSKFAKKTRAELAAKYNIPVYSSATDTDVIKGYWSLGLELSKTIMSNTDKKNVLFVPVSSGAGLIGLMQGLSIDIQHDHLLPKVIVCQTAEVHPLVDADIPAENSLAEAITDRSCLRSPQIMKVLNETSGKAFAVSNDELIKAQSYAKSNFNLELSYTSLLSIAGYLRLKEMEEFDNGICIASGR